MDNFHQCNKVTGVYWLNKPASTIIKAIKIFVHPQDGISLPKFEDYSLKSDIPITRIKNNTEVYEFSWQEKVFSRWELQRYNDVHNCITDNELNYHDAITNNDCTAEKVFTYIHEDNYLPLPLQNKTSQNIPLLNSCFDKLTIKKKLGKLLVSETTSSTAHLFRSEENLLDTGEEWLSMHIVFDNSEYNDDSNLLLKQEAVLLSLYYNTTNNCLIISPDTNSLELNPYSLETSNGIQWGYRYGVEVEFKETEGGDDLMLLLNKLSKKWERKHKPLLSFVVPPLGKKQYFVSLEIITANNFDMDHMYIDYTIQVPKNLVTRDALRGSTHVSHSAIDDDRRRWHYGHLVDLQFEIDIGEEPPPITIFFEAISTDWWGRHRTEGYSHLSLTLAPGYHKRTLSCSRPEEKDEVIAKSRRFFVGGCHLIKDLDVLTKPQIQDTNYKFTTTGNIEIRWNTISQSQASLTSQQYVEYSRTNSSSALLLGAETALKKYKKARAKLAAATKGFGGKCDGSGDS